MKSPYDILEIPSDADDELIKAAWRRVARETHPDLHPGDASTAERFKIAAAAHELLTDPIRRAAYDKSQRPSTVCTVCGSPHALPGVGLCIRCSVVTRTQRAAPPPMPAPQAGPSYRDVGLGSDVIGKQRVDDYFTEVRGMTADSLLEALLAESAIRSTIGAVDPDIERNGEIAMQFVHGDTAFRVRVDTDAVKDLAKSLKTTVKALDQIRRLFT